MSSKDLPSIDDFAEDSSNLPSIDEFITEEVEEELPSVEDFIEKEQEIITEQTQTIEDANGETFAEVQDIVPPWPELVKMVNDIRADIPDIPEIKYYDKELEQLAEQISQIRNEIPEVPEVRYYENEVEAICGQIDLVREEIKTKIQNLPEVKYYDEQVDQIEDRIDTLQTEVANLPEVKYYDAEIAAICEAIDSVKESIPTFPKWVNEVNEVPDFSWIGKTFSVIDDDFIKVNDTIDTLKEHVKLDIKKLVEENEVKHFENRVQFGTEVKDLDTKLGEEKDKIWKELRSSSMKIWEYHKEFKDDDKKLKKQIKNEYNSLKNQLEQNLSKYNLESVKTDELLLNYFNGLKEEISNLPEVKYYDDDISDIKGDISSLRSLVQSIKTEQKQIKDIQEGLLNEPPTEKEDVGSGVDPLTPMDQKFATLDDLAGHYRLFINRIQQQIATIGGGGAGFVKDLDDVSFDQTTGTNELLIYNGAKWVGIASTALSPTITLDDALTNGNSSTKGMSVGVLTATDAFITGDLNVTGDLVYDEVTGRNINITGVGTVTKLHVGVSTDATEDLVVTGDARVTGILTVGTGSVTINGNTNDISGVGVITATSLVGNLTGDVTGNATGLSGSPDIALTNITAGIITASSALYIPQYTTSARDAATFAEGAIIYNTTTKKINFYDGTTFVELPGVTLGLGMGVF